MDVCNRLPGLKFWGKPVDKPLHLKWSLSRWRKFNFPDCGYAETIISQLLYRVTHWRFYIYSVLSKTMPGYWVALYLYVCDFACITVQHSTWQSSTLVLITPFIYSFSMVGETPKLFPMQSISVLPSGYVTSTEPFKMTDQESSCKSNVAGYMKTESLNTVTSYYIGTILTILPKEKLFLAPVKNIYKLVYFNCAATSSSRKPESYV